MVLEILSTFYTELKFILPSTSKLGISPLTIEVLLELLGESDYRKRDLKGNALIT